MNANDRLAQAGGDAVGGGGGGGSRSGSDYPPTPRYRRSATKIIRPFSCIAFLLIPVISISFFAVPPPSLQFVSLLHSVVNSTSFVTVHSLDTSIPEPPFTLFSTRVILPNASYPGSAYLCIDEHGTFVAVTTTLLGLPRDCRQKLFDVSPLVVMPGLIDPHVHINSPGKEDWEGFDSAMRAAAVGGTTTMLDMPINSMPATIDSTSHKLKVASLMNSSFIVNVGLIGGIVPQNVDNLKEMFDAGVIALKSFMVDTQSPDFHMLSTDQLHTAIDTLHQWHVTHQPQRRIPYIIHAELDDFSQYTGARMSSEESFDHFSYVSYEATRPKSWETSAVGEIINAMNGSQVHIHVAHVSAVEVIDLIRSARQDGLNDAIMTAETCAHYLIFSKEEIPSGATLYKCAPPIRDRNNRDRLIDETFLSSTRQSEDRVIDIVVTDHSPSASHLKETNGNLTAAWGGIAGLQYRLQATTQVARDRNISLVEISRVLSEQPAKLFGLDDQKGSFSVGKDADLVIWDPDADYMVSQDSCEHKVKPSAFDGWELHGVVWYTLVQGRVAFQRVEDAGHQIHGGHGKYLRRDASGQVQKSSASDFVAER